MTTNLRVLTGHHFIGTALLLAFCLLGPITAVSQDAASLPEGEGRDLVSDKCALCHALSTAVIKRASRDVWQETVNRMVTTYRAPINETEGTIILDYLSANFGEGSSYNPGQQMLAEQCFRCHGEGMWSDLKTDRTGWLSALYRMVGRGGVWTEDQITVMADYLAATYSEGAGK